jgi:hypothetical protein
MLRHLILSISELNSILGYLMDTILVKGDFDTVFLSDYTTNAVGSVVRGTVKMEMVVTWCGR